MHETAIAKDILGIVNETLGEHPPQQLKTVYVVVGEMIAVVPELLQHAYHSLIVDTSLQHSKLDITIIPISGLCETCRAAFSLQDFEFLCPFCQSDNISVKTGNEFYIKELEVEPCPS